MATFTFFDEFGSDLGKGVHNFSSHQLKVAFTNTAPSQDTWATFSNVTGEVSNGVGGYSTGGVVLDSVAWAETSAGSGTWFLDSANELFTASGASVGPFQYLILYNDGQTSPADPLIGYVNLGTGVTVPDGQTFEIQLGANGWFTIPIT